MRRALLPLLSLPPFLAPAAATAAGTDWTTINLGTSEDLVFIQKGSTSYRYVVGTGGFVALSPDGNMTTWNPVMIGTSQDLLSVHEVSAGDAWISGAAGTGRRYVDPNWENINLPTSGEDFAMFSRSSGWAFAVGSGGSIYRTTDAGATWNPQSSGTMLALHAGNGFVGSTAICVGDVGTILKTSNGGGLWTPKTSGTSENLYAYADVAGGVLAAGGGGVIVKSTDAGETWATVPTPTAATIRDLDVSPQNAAWVLAAGDGGTCLLSTDAGSSWCAIVTGTTTDLFACDMILNGTWVVAGADGLMMKTENSGGGCATSAVAEESWGKVKAGYR